jgi:hypothetical protein
MHRLQTWSNRTVFLTADDAVKVTILDGKSSLLAMSVLQRRNSQPRRFLYQLPPHLLVEGAGFRRHNVSSNTRVVMVRTPIIRQNTQLLIL